MKRWFYFLLFLSFCLGLYPAHAQQISSPIESLIGKSERQVTDFKNRLSDFSREMGNPSLPAERLGKIKSDLEKIRLDAILASQALAPSIVDTKTQIDKFAPLVSSPQANPLEPQGGGLQQTELLQQKDRLKVLLSRLEAAKTALDLSAGDAEQLAAQIAALQRDNFFKRIFEPSRSILNPLLWTDALRDVPMMLERMVNLLRNSEQDAFPSLLSLLGIFFLGGSGFFLAIIAWKWILKEPSSPIEFSYFTRLLVSVKTLVGTTLLLLIAVFSFHALFSIFGFMSPRLVHLARTFAESLAAIFFARAFAVSVFRPKCQALRLVPVRNRSAAKLLFLFTFAGIISGFDHLFSEISSILYLPVTLSVSWIALSTCLMLGIIAIALFTLRRPSETLPASKISSFWGWWEKIALLLWGLLFLAGISLLLGYIALGEFLTTQIFDTAIILTTLYLLHHLADGFVVGVLQSDSTAGHFLKTFFTLKDQTLKRIAVLFSTVVDILIVLLGIPILLAHWSFTWINYSGWFTAFLEGVTIGSLTLSPAHFLIGISVLIIGLVLSKGVTFWLDRRVLSRIEMDTGVRHSIQTSARYALLLIVVLLSISSTGFNIANLALIAGALGVGIGFGLQSIVNNFVSGLILLAERPIKVGDWVIVGAGEGTVKKINVRSTTIEMFDRSSVIVPNSSLITEALINKTYASTSQIGRIMLRISTTQEACPEEVRDTLLELAIDHPNSLAFPEPFVILSGFMPGTFEFTLYVYIPDITQCMRIESEIRFAIHKSFAEKNISLVPLPFKHVSQKSLERSKKGYNFSVRQKGSASYLKTGGY